jgi:hypothetical protein
VSNTEFEGGDDGHGHGDHTFLVKQAQPSHNIRGVELELKTLISVAVIQVQPLRCEVQGVQIKLLPLPLTNGHGRYITVTPERTLVSVGEWPLHIAVINL